MNAPGPPRGILRSREPAPGNEHRRHSPGPALAESVAHFWWVRWSLPEPFVTETLPHPSVHLVFEEGRAEIAGVSTARFVRELRGEGHVFGIKFRPAAFTLLGGSAHALAERVLPLGAHLGDELATSVLAADGFEAKMAAATAWLEARVMPLSAERAALRDLVERMAADHTLLRAEQAASALGVDLRTLQRRFRAHVGVSPKWVIQRYRLHEAAERLKAEPVSFAALATELGYADQAHFTREFKAMVGTTPGKFVARRGCSA